MVEMRGVEPLSKSPAAKLSTSVVNSLNLALLSPIDRLLNCQPDKVFPKVLRAMDFEVSCFVTPQFFLAG